MRGVIGVVWSEDLQRDIFLVTRKGVLSPQYTQLDAYTLQTIEAWIMQGVDKDDALKRALGIK